ncbi:MAG: hypothetical protein K6G16_00275 [Lachnospiraceae bacterium]|nr:hypothetical protein [Lachnospiraceae bacterium]
MKKLQLSTEKKYTILFIFLEVLLILYIMISTAFVDSGYRERIRPFSSEWTLDDGRIWKIDDVLPHQYGGQVTMRKKLPENLSDDDCLCFETRNASIKIWVDDREVYTFEPKENLTGHGYGDAFHMIGLRKWDAGKTVRIRSQGMNNLLGGRISGVCLAPAQDYIYMNITKRALPALLSLLIVFLGVVMLIIHFMIPDKENMPFSILSLGLVALLAGFWLLVDTNIMQLLSGRLYLWRSLNRTVILLAAFPCVSFFNSITKLRRPVYLHIAFWYSLLAFCLMVGLRFFAGIDMARSFSVAITAVILGVIVLMTVILIDNYLYCRTNAIPIGFRSFYFGMIVFFACALLDVLLYLSRRFQLNMGDSYGVFSRIGLAFFATLSLVQFLSWWAGSRAEIGRDRFINRALQYAVSTGDSGGSEGGVDSMLQFMGKELQARRVCIFEEQGNGRFHGTYEWHEEGLPPSGVDLIYMPYEGYVQELYKAYVADGNRLIVRDPEKYRSSQPGLYNLLKNNHVDNAVAGPLESNGKMIGFLAILDVPAQNLNETSEIVSMLSYFLTQLIVQREEQKRLHLYSFRDSFSGALNRRAFKEFIDIHLDQSAAFGYLVCRIDDVGNNDVVAGRDTVDLIAQRLVRCMNDVFGNERVYRLTSTDFAAFGFETEESFFTGDVDRVKRLAADQGLHVSVGAVYCAYGTMGMERVMRRAGDMLKDARDK